LFKISGVGGWQMNFTINADGVLEKAALEGKAKVVVPDGVVRIGDFAFEGCEGLTSIVITEGVVAIGVHAFRGCTALEKAVIYDSVEDIGEGAFDGCS